MQDETRREESAADGQGAARSWNEPGAGSPGPGGGGVLTLVCLTCGTEYHFDRQDPPPGLTCEKCGGGVFRDFFTPVEGDDAAQDFSETTERDLDPDDPEGDVLPGDLVDLNRD